MARKAIVDIEIEGNPLSPLSGLTLHQRLGGHHHFEVRCPLREQERTLPGLCGQYLGKEIKMEFRSGKGDRGAPTFFRGVVTSVRIAKEHTGQNQVLIAGHSPTCTLEDGPHCQSFLEKKLADIVQATLDRYGLQAQVKPRHTARIPYFVQYQEDAFHFLHRLAARYGEWFYYDGATLYFGAPEAADPLEVKFGRDVYQLSLSLQAAPTHFRLLGYDSLGHQFPESPSS
ncbi:MAG TPA: contractile injection system protein, VgrG/Pvc8 family, partial [Cytophagales bacterium]